MIRLYCLTFFFSIIFLFHLNSQTLIISEVLAANTNLNYDGFGEQDDWIEFYNIAEDTIQMSGMFLTNDSLNPTKHQIGFKSENWTKINPKSYALYWLDNDPEQGQRHISFTIKKKGGYLSLYDRDTNLVDHMTFGEQTDNISFGKINPESNDLGFFKVPTPNKKNKNGQKVNMKPNKVKLSLSSGFYQGPQTIELSANQNPPIYYSLDGSEPTKISSLYTKPIKINSNTVIRARVISDGYRPNLITNASYFINEKSELSVVSLIVSPNDLWDKRKGIYSNFENREIEAAAHVEYFDAKNKGVLKLAISKSAATRIAGKTSRRQPKKSFSFFATNEDGQGERFNYPVFEDKEIEDFSGLWVRADATSGRNVSDLWVGERFKNELLYEVNRQMNGQVDMQAYEPVSVFLNGQYWGLYNLMERKGKDFIFNNHGEAEVDILTSSDAKAVSGNISEYDQMISYIAQNDITQDSIYKEILNQIHVDSYIDYWVNETYCGARDISVNIRYWKSKSPDAKWRWISYDQDSWYTAQEESLKYYLDKGKVYLFERLMKNQTFRDDWINRMCDYLNKGFKAQNVISLVDKITGRIAIEIDRDRRRWQDSMLYIKKGERISWIKDYAVKRPEFIRKHIIDYFKLEHGVSDIQVIQNVSMGHVKINSIDIRKSFWTGKYIENIPIYIEAIPNKGYAFDKWKSKGLPQKRVITVKTKKNKKFIPIFKKIE
ncbi:MAG: hypothetical protein CL857_05545 [Cryomorphaceae bacterium]|nr:hypothetical protein [Cryomorphaceae bacterium]